MLDISTSDSRVNILQKILVVTMAAMLVCGMYMSLDPPASSVHVEDSQLFSGDSLPMVVAAADPYTNQAYYLGSTTSTASAVISTDGLGWYKATNCTTDQQIVTSTNASAVINGVIGECALTGTGTVFIQNCGTPYIITNSIMPATGVDLESNKAVLMCAPNTQISVIDAKNVNNVIINGLVVDGNKANNVGNSRGYDMTQNGIHFYNTSYSQITNCEVRNTVMHGVNIHYNSNYNLISDNFVHDNGMNTTYSTQGGILLFTNATSNIVTKNRLFNNYYQEIYVSYAFNTVISDNVMAGILSPVGGEGIHLTYGTTGTVVSNNAISNISGIGIFVNPQAIPTFDNQILGNSITSGTAQLSYGIWIQYANNVIISQNFVNGTLYDGIRVQASNNCAVTNNNVEDGSQKSNNYSSGIQFDSNSTHNIAIGNIIRSSGLYPNHFKYGIREDTVADDYNSFSYNDIDGTSLAPIHRMGPHTTVTGNIGYVTEQFGTAKITSATNVHVTTILAGIPSVVVITPQGASYAGGTYGVYNLTATGFNILMANSGNATFGWAAYYIPP